MRVLLTRGLCALLPLLFSFRALGQSITLLPPSEFFVCEEGLFHLRVDNPLPTPLNNPRISLNFRTLNGTDCQLAYVPGSVQGAAEEDVSNPKEPVFSTASIPPEDSLVFSFRVRAPCEVFECINSAELFVSTLALTHDGGSFTTTSLPYVIETPLLVIVEVNPSLMKGSKGDVLVRRIRVRNTRLGSLSAFTFTDSHQGGIDIRTPVGTLLEETPTRYEIRLDANDFVLFNTGADPLLFEEGEEIIIEENILVESCGDTLRNTLSRLSVSWGCLNTTCQVDQADALILIEPSERQGKLVFTPTAEASTCNCGQEAIPQHLLIENEGNGPARDIQIKIEHLSPVGGIWPSSIRLDSMGHSLDPALTLLNPLDTPNFRCVWPQDTLFGGFTLQVPHLEAGAALDLSWELFPCQLGCGQNSTLWNYSAHYFNECGPNFFVETPPAQASSTSPLLVKSSFRSSPVGLWEGDTTSLFYFLASDLLTALEEQLLIRVFLPCPLEPMPYNQYLLGTQAPDSVRIDEVEEGTVVRAYYDLPHATDASLFVMDVTTSCDPECTFRSCIHFDNQTSCRVIDPCLVPAGDSVEVSLTAYFPTCDASPFPQCGLADCKDTLVISLCPRPDTCIVYQDGHIQYALEFGRSSLGLPDNDNDHWPDPNGVLNLDSIRRHHYLTGDTLRIAARGVVVMDTPGATYPAAQLLAHFISVDLDSINLPLLTEEGLSFLNGTLLIFDRSANTWLKCTEFTPRIRVDSAEILFNISFAPSDMAIPCNFPLDYVYEAGDSVIWEGFFRILYNMDPSQMVGTIFANVDFKLTPHPLLINSLDCSCIGHPMTISGYQTQFFRGVYVLDPCEEKDFLGGDLFSFTIGEPDFFPYEYRPFARVDWWEIAPDLGVNPAETQLRFVRFQAGTDDILSDVTLPPSVQGGRYRYFLDEVIQPPVEEGFHMLLQYRFRDTCALSEPVELGRRLMLLPQGPLTNLDLDPWFLDVSSVDLRPLQPVLRMEAPMTQITWDNNRPRVPFRLFNLVSSVGSLMSGRADNVWIQPVTSSGLLDEFVLVNQTTGDTLLPVNGLFQLDTLAAGDSLDLLLLLRNNSCQPEHLELRYGWSCDPVTHPQSFSCFSKSLDFILYSPPGELELDLTGPTSCTELCDTVDYHTVEIFNAELGAVYNLYLEAALPEGWA
ncbi:MAG: hypothetical protein D6765_06980, partial [Bacteroidetes bacterium]